MRGHKKWHGMYSGAFSCLMIITAVAVYACQNNYGSGARAATGILPENLAGTWSIMASGFYDRPALTPICPFTLGGSFTLDSSGSGTGSLSEHGCADDVSHPNISFAILEISPSGKGTAILTLLSDSTPIKLDIQVDKNLKVMSFVDLTDSNFYLSGVCILH